ncbi:hypothetical protein IFM89_028087 [Coptis chinensis]|uniref:F-box associated domain-containing protein n=1 Tax=Coptis chinensis TaxID=261450 RepID=A0A835LKS8_9MAGN|nr:hypothetical protein IFM89_028087 [Coptis chinensis]
MSAAMNLWDYYEFKEPDGKHRDVCLSGFGFEDSKMEYKMVIVMFVERGSQSGLYENRVQSSENGVPIIVSFSLGVEEFGFVSILSSHLRKPTEDRYSLWMLEGDLSVVQCTSQCNVGIWVMKKYNIKESWVKQFSEELDSLCHRGFRRVIVEIIKLCESGDIALLCDSKYMVS